MSHGRHEAPRRTHRAPDVDGGRSRVTGPATHVLGVGALLLTAAWLMRRFLLSSALPAGTDMLGFISRAQQNAGWESASSLWAPTGWGARRTFTMDNVLGVLTIATRDPVVTVKLLAVLTLFASGAFVYLLTWGWYRRAAAATFAGLLFMTSQSSVTRWASGQLNVQVAMAMMPLLIYLWSLCVERFTVRRAVVVAVATSVVLLVRLDMILYVLPFLALYTVVMAVLTPQPRLLARNVAASAAVAFVVTLALNLYQLLPVVLGLRAQWISLGRLFDLAQFLDRSLPAYPSLLGFGREIGYLGFTGQQTWYSHPFLSFSTYTAVATVLVLIAYAAPFWYRGRRTIFLLCCALATSFFAKGIRPPAGDLYLWVIQHFGVLQNLRSPNRWLTFQALALAVLAGLVLDQLVMWMASRRAAGSPGRLRRATAMAGVAVPVLLVLLIACPTIFTGFRTWQPEQGQVDLMRRLRQEGDRSVVASIPYRQAVAFVQQGSYRGYEHDLGTESSTFSGRPTVGDGGWNQHASDFTAFTTSLLRTRDPAFQELLGSVGVRHLLEFKYPATSPHLTDGADESDWQQRALRGMPGFVPLAGNDQGAIYRLAAATPMVSFRPNTAVILGGRAGIAAFADLPGVDLRRWAVVTADDAIHQGGLPGLLELVRSSTAVVVANERLADLAVLAAYPLSRASGMTSASGLDRRTILVPSDASTRRGSLSDRSVPLPIDGANSVTSTFDAPAAQPLEIWTRVKMLRKAATLTFQLDGETVKRLTPVGPYDGGFRWLPVAAGHVTPGTHTLTVAASHSEFGAAFEVDEVRVVEASARAAAQASLRSALAAAGDRTVYAFDLRDAQKWSATPYLSTSPTVVSKDATRYWSVVDREDTLTRRGRAPHGSTALTITAPAGRASYAMVAHRYQRPRDWSRRPYLYVDIRGYGGGQVYTLVVDFGNGDDSAARYRIHDDHPGWRTVALSTAEPDDGEGPFRWSHVVGLRLATQTKQDVGFLTLGAVRLTPPVRSTSFSYPITPSASDRSLALVSAVDGGPCPGAPGLAPVRAGAGRLDVRVPVSVLKQPCRLLVNHKSPVRQLDAPPVHVRRLGATEYRVSLASAHGGVLVLNQAFDTKWAAVLNDGTSRSPSPIAALVNGFFVPAGRYSGTIAWEGDRVGHLGLALSGIALLGAVVIVALPSRRRLQVPSWREWARGIGPDGKAQEGFVGLPAQWAMPWFLGLLGIALLPMINSLGGPRLADPVIVLLLALLTVGVGMLGAAERMTLEDAAFTPGAQRISPRDSGRRMVRHGGHHRRRMGATRPRSRLNWNAPAGRHARR